jgi:hypothetical protein
MSIVIPVILIAMLLIPALALSSRFEKKRFLDLANAMQVLNENLQLAFNKPELKFLPTEFPSLKGSNKGFELAIFIETTHKNKSLVIELDLGQTEDFSFTLREQTSLDNIGILAGEKDIETKDKVFDRKFFVSSNLPDQMIQLLNEHCRQFALQHYVIFEKGIITLEKGKLQYRHYSPLFVLNNKDKTLKVIEFMILLSTSIKEQSKTKL